MIVLRKGTDPGQVEGGVDPGETVMEEDCNR